MIDFDIRDPGPVLALVNEWYKIASTSVGVDPREAKKLESMLVSAGFEQVERKIVSIPIGEWPTEKGKVSCKVLPFYVLYFLIFLY
jgi:hypothetical protein